MSYRFQTSISTLCKNKVYCLYYVINVARSSIQKQLFGGMWAFKQTMMIQSNSLIFRHNCFFKNSKSPIIYLPTRKDVSAYKVRSFSRMSRRSNQRDSVSSDANSNVNKNTQGIVISRKPGVETTLRLRSRPVFPLFLRCCWGVESGWH